MTPTSPPAMPEPPKNDYPWIPLPLRRKLYAILDDPSDAEEILDEILHLAYEHRGLPELDRRAAFYENLLDQIASGRTPAKIRREALESFLIHTTVGALVSLAPTIVSWLQH